MALVNAIAKTLKNNSLSTNIFPFPLCNFFNPNWISSPSALVKSNTFKRNFLPRPQKQKHYLLQSMWDENIFHYKTLLDNRTADSKCIAKGNFQTKIFCSTPFKPITHIKLTPWRCKKNPLVKSFVIAALPMHLSQFE